MRAQWLSHDLREFLPRDGMGLEPGDPNLTRLVANVRQAVDRLERAGSGGRDLIEDASVTHRHHFTTKSVFTMLTLLRWYCLTIARSG